MKKQFGADLQENGFIKDLIKGNRLPKARVIITSTPFVSYHLHEYIDRSVELFDLVKSIKNKFIAAALKEHTVAFKMLQKHFQMYPEIDMLSCIPVNMAIIVCLGSKNIHTPNQLPCYAISTPNKLPCSAVEMYNAFCIHVMEVMCSLVVHVQKERQNEIPYYENESIRFTLNNESRKKLQCIAYVALIKNKVIFLENDLCDMCREYPTCYGLMQSIECYSSAHHNKSVIQLFIPWYTMVSCCQVCTRI